MPTPDLTERCWNLHGIPVSTVFRREGAMRRRWPCAFRRGPGRGTASPLPLVAEPAFWYATGHSSMLNVGATPEVVSPPIRLAARQLVELLESRS